MSSMILFLQGYQSIGTPRSAKRRSGAPLREAGARSERNSGNGPGARAGAQLRKFVALRRNLKNNFQKYLNFGLFNEPKLAKSS